MAGSPFVASLVAVLAGVFAAFGLLVPDRLSGPDPGDADAA